MTCNNDCNQSRNCDCTIKVAAQGFDEFWRDNAQPWHDYDTAREFWEASRDNLEQAYWIGVKE